MCTTSSVLKGASRKVFFFWKVEESRVDDYLIDCLVQDYSLLVIWQDSGSAGSTSVGVVIVTRTPFT